MYILKVESREEAKKIAIGNHWLLGARYKLICTTVKIEYLVVNDNSL